MPTEKQIAELVNRLASDEVLVRNVLANPSDAFKSFNLPPALNRSINANRANDVRSLIGLDDEGLIFVAEYTSGDKCSTACTRAGCYTEGKCPSDYGCSGAPGCK